MDMMHSYASRITKHFAELLWLYGARQRSPFSKSTGKDNKHRDWRGGDLLQITQDFIKGLEVEKSTPALI